MTLFERVLANAAIVAGIAFFSTLSITYPPTPQNLWAAFIAGALALLTQLRTLFPDAQINEENTKPKPPLGMLI